MKKTVKATLIATAIATLPFGAGAAGLGAVNVFSGLGQPLRAEIEVKATPLELQSLSVRVGGADAFRQANFALTPIVSNVRMSIERRGEKAFVKVSSDQPVRDPFLDLVVELNWAAGRVLREYTFLLDPVDTQRPVVAAVQPEPATRTAAAPRPQVSSPAPAPAQASRVAAAMPETHRVERGDTLREIASRYQQPGANLDQMLIALLRQNPEAFDGGNINRLRAGAILRLPDADTAMATEPATARREVIAQAADFEAFRNRLAGSVKTRAEGEVEPTRERAGTIVPKVEEPVRAEAPTDRVEVSAGSDAAPTSVDAERLARLQALEEELIAREKALQEANARLLELEAMVSDLQKLVELRSQGLAQMQQQASPVAAAAEAGEGDPVAVQAAETPVAQPEDEPVAASEPPVDVPQERLPVVSAPELAPAPAPAPVVAAEPPPPAPRPTTPPPAPVEVPEPNLLDFILEDPTLLAGGGGIALLLLGYGAYRMRQRRKAEPEGDESSSVQGEDQTGSHSVFGVKGGQSVDTGASSMLHTDFSQSGLSAIDADEGVDPVAEADVYMAYGRDAQAEEILLDALKADASRPAIYLKLLEVYAARPSVKQFEAVATDFYSRTGGHGHDWQQAAEMGRKIDPANPLYTENTKVRMDEPPATEISRDALAPDVASMRGASVASATAAGIGLGTQIPPSAQAAEVERLADVSLADLDFSHAPVEPSASSLKAPKSPEASNPFSDATGGGDDSAAAGAPALEPITPDSEDNPAPEDLSALDFDLDTTPTSLPVLDEKPTEPSAPVASAADELTFDLDIGDPPVSLGSRPGASGAAAASSDFSLDKTVVGSELDLDLAEMGDDMMLDFDTPALEPAATSAKSPAKSPAEAGGSAGGVVTRTSGGDDTDLQATRIEGGLGTGDDSAEMDLEKTGFDNNLLDFDFDLESSTPTQTSEVRPFDLSNIDLDLELPDVPGLQPEPSKAPSAAVPDFSIDDAPSILPDANQEAETKLDLARAYEDMGDKEGARELIEEVIREGSPDQVAKAKALLAQLG